MRLALSSAVVPGLPLESLVEGCRRRGLAGLELVVGTGPLEQKARQPGALLPGIEHGVGVVGLLHPGSSSADPLADVSLLARLGIPLVLPGVGRSRVELTAIGRAAGAARGRVLLLHGSDPAEVAMLRQLVAELPTGAAALAWQVDPASDDPDQLSAVVREAGTALAYVRLLGGGPESVRQTGLGIGALMGRLALARFSGPLVLTSSHRSYHYAWRAWLGRAAGWGCGSRQSDAALVDLHSR
jgi:hypothetical protein